jgi:hypothetical protein
MGRKELAECPQPPVGSSATAIEAWTLVNQIRLAAAGSCMNMVPALNASAQNHCDYIAMNRGNSACGSGHDQVEGCTGFSGTTAQAREIAAGYPRNLAYTEVLFNIGNMPARAIQGWLNTPFHRIPLIDPWTTDMGWGGGAGCDIIDIGRGTMPAPDNAVVVFPYDGQTDVPLSFNGLESPAPPKPASGWPSAYPVSIYAKRLTVSEHVITKDGDPTPLPHMWLDAKAPEVTSGLRGYFTSTAMMYGAPYEPNTKYRVRIAGTSQGGPLNVEWTFTTGQRSAGR